jgi:hypothetical protein
MTWLRLEILEPLGQKTPEIPHTDRTDNRLSATRYYIRDRVFIRHGHGF